MTKKVIFSVLCLCFGVAATAAPKLVYNGDTLAWNTEFSRKQCGTLDINENIIEVSGIACSRVTPGYIWMQSDETERYIIATDEKGAERACKLKFSKNIRWDWEDLSGGVYEGKNYLFIGAFGDNEETGGNYSVVWVEEPAIDPLNTPELTVTPNQIKFVYPDGKNHNCEALMYDNREQMIYIITKVYYDVCQVFRMPFRTDYGTETQTLEYICDLGLRSDLGYSEQNKPYKGFHLVTGADISPDGRYILIKNHNNIVASYSWILYWEREEGESVADALKRQPQPLKCYSYEWQGEAICWLDNYTFYTTSDADDGNPPIYRYTRPFAEGVEQTPSPEAQPRPLRLIEGHLYIDSPQGLYTLDGRRL